jgi:hypothetical protein
LMISETLFILRLTYPLSMRKNPFIQHVEESAIKQGAKVLRCNDNGRTFPLDGVI